MLRWHNQRRDIPAQARVHRHFLRRKKKSFWLAWTSSLMAALSAARLQDVFLLHNSTGNMFHPPFLLQTKPPFSTNPHCTPLHYSRSINQTPHDSHARVLPSVSSSRYMLSLYSLISPCMHVLMQHGRDQALLPSEGPCCARALPADCGIRDSSSRRSSTAAPPLPLSDQTNGLWHEKNSRSFLDLDFPHNPSSMLSIRFGCMKQKSKRSSKRKHTFKPN